MPHDVFISHSSKDREIVDKICFYLEETGIYCWMAPRDIRPGNDWVESIVSAVTESKLVLLVLSSNSNSSPHISREVNIADEEGIPILPFRVENIQLSKRLRYYLSTPHWLDALPPPVEDHFEHLLRSARTFIPVKFAGGAGAMPFKKSPIDNLPLLAPTDETTKVRFKKASVNIPPIGPMSSAGANLAHDYSAEIRFQETSGDQDITTELEGIEDLAPIFLRFEAGLFDLIIGCFGSFIALSPFILTGGNFFTLEGLLAFLATFVVFLFIYITAWLSLYGKTFGMRIFSLELVDVEESDYPTFDQAAINSSIYILSLALGGIGFITIPFNAEKRALHDLLSGTIMVREF